ncbi:MULTISPECIES: metallophosphoesterase [Cyanophyceae]|uniref:metallophosphoesterase family protein n=1 Tax=Cyanophyceae TaxID=3028117 RepID=UPI001689328E|nr:MULTISPECIES: metallophosphoesterase [Cyanophyceae]MBD1919084.1 metallophosphoesterase family protein [Phormidium sp. FACHB-77]MBD2033085.1 metallophosphoesterase family protein [Phormidium sp. FACHB-322]MBD2054013.1 metallophosphoesterase family protein [Leptolyngbya sp. FACHB-60]
MRREDLTLLTTGLLLVITAILLIALEPRQLTVAPSPEASAVTTHLLTDPFLQNPTSGTVRVVWFTEFEGQDHQARWGSPGQPSEANLPNLASATTTRLARTREDGQSRIDHPNFAELQQTVARPIWRHEAVVTGLPPGQRVPYRVASTGPDGTVIESRTFTLAGAPAAGRPTKILLTSDHQNMPMVAANLQKVVETLGQVDAVFLAGDLVNTPDRASEWFDDSRGTGFFPCLQGNTRYDLERNGRTVTYRGGEIIQHAPLFPALGNHEVMGRFAAAAPLGEQFNQAIPRSTAVDLYETNADLFNPADDPALRRQWIIDNSFNSDTYEALFSLPTTQVPNPDRPETTSRYYAVTFGDVRLVSLYVTQIWRPYNVDAATRGRYQEREADLGTPQNWGHGQHIFEPIEGGSLQYQWLEQELASEAFRQAKYKVVMLHHPPHTLGDNIVPAFTNPVRRYDRDSSGRLTAVRYEYPRTDDYIARDLVPLLEQAGVDLVFYGHSHLWNRFVSPQGTHYLETSNVGNSYGAFWKDQSRPVPPETIEGSAVTYSPSDYVAQGDPNGLEPVVPTIAPLRDDSGQPLPYLASNDITAFSLFDTGSGTISSYYFDTREPNSAVVKFDEFAVGQ